MKFVRCTTVLIAVAVATSVVWLSACGAQTPSILKAETQSPTVSILVPQVGISPLVSGPDDDLSCADGVYGQPYISGGIMHSGITAENGAFTFPAPSQTSNITVIINHHLVMATNPDQPPPDRLMLLAVDVHDAAGDKEEITDLDACWSS